MRKFEDERVFMNTRIQIQVFSDAGTVFTRQKLDNAYGLFQQVVDKFTRFDERSELSRLNNSKGKTTKVSPEFFLLVNKLLELATISAGAFDPTIIDVLEAYGYDKNYAFEKLDNPRLLAEIQQLVQHRPDYKNIVLDSQASTVQLNKGIRIDLGSIGKGYAIDLAYNELDEFPAFLINAGGDIRAKGQKPDKTDWTAGLYKATLPNQAPDGKALWGTVALHNQSLAASGGWARRVRFFHHLLNPKTGLPVNDVSQTFVIAPTALDADGWSTLLFVTGKPALRLIEQHGFAGLIIFADGTIESTKGFRYSEL